MWMKVRIKKSGADGLRSNVALSAAVASNKLGEVMKALRFILFAALAGFVLYVRYAAPHQVGGAGSSAAQAGQSDVVADHAVPGKALQVLDVVRRTGQPPDGYVGGTVFQNREGRLPEGGDYREYDVDPHHGQRNAERIIVDVGSGKAWYTGDHYRTFQPLP
jgi:guanyl-specific ribonuclease Sa